MAYTNPNVGFVNGALVGQSDLNAINNNILYIAGTTGAPFSAAATFTPTLTQSNTPALTSAVGRYLQTGKRVDAWVNITCNGAGTGGSSIIVGALPVASIAGATDAGHGVFSRAGLVYQLEAVFTTTTSVVFYVSTFGGQFGGSPATTLAASDVLQLTFCYEAA